MPDPSALNALIAANPGASDDELAKLAAADPRTARAIPLPDLLAILGTYEVLGSIQLAAMDPATDLDTKRKLLNAIGFLQPGNKPLATDTAEIAAKVDFLLLALSAAKAIPPEAVAEIVDLGGGYQLRGAVAADFAAARSANDRQAAINAVRDKVNAAVATFLNETVNPAQADKSKDLPSFEQFKSYVGTLK